MRDRNCLAVWIMTSSSTAQIFSAMHRKLTSTILNKSTFIPAQTEYKLQSIEFKVMNSQENMNWIKKPKNEGKKINREEVLDVFFQSSIGCPVMS